MRRQRALTIIVVCLAVFSASLLQAAPRSARPLNDSRPSAAHPADASVRADLWRALWLLALTRTPVLLPEPEPMSTRGISDGPDPIGSTPDPPVGRGGSNGSHGSGSRSSGGSAGDYQRPSSEGSASFSQD
jgi:hypothetical protein